MKVYLAGPMRGIRHYNKEAFDRAAGLLRRSGFEVISPIEMDEAMGVDFTDPELQVTDEQVEEMLERDLGYIQECDAVCLLAGWMNSRGVKREYPHAIRHGKFIFDLRLMLEAYGL